MWMAGIKPERDKETRMSLHPRSSKRVRCISPSAHPGLRNSRRSYSRSRAASCDRASACTVPLRYLEDQQRKRVLRF
jgi:hypothetical protein